MDVINSKEYWAKREAEALKHYITDEKAYEAEIKKIYSNMLDACQGEINAFYGKYASKEGISLAEAKKRVKQADIAAYERKAKRYVKDKDFSAKANEEMRLYNTMMKINRLEMLKANIGLELISGSDELDKFMGKILKGRTEEELQRQAGILGKTIKNNAQKAHAIVNGSFHSGTFSDRIWQYQDLMREELGALLQTGLIQGKNPRALTKELKKYFIGKDGTGGMRYCMERLMRTELARVQTEAQKQSFIRNGFEEYEFIVNGGCCPICEGLKGKHFKVEKMMPGENAPPMHPHCRCSTAAWSNRKEYDEWLDFLDQGGTTEEWNKLKTQTAYNDPSWLKAINGKINSLITKANVDSDTIKMGTLLESSKLGDTHGKAIQALVAQAPDNIKHAWNKYAKRLDVEDAHSNASYCNFIKGIHCDIDKAAKGDKRNYGLDSNGKPLFEETRKPYYAALHEFGHNLSALMAYDSKGGSHGSIANIYQSKKFTYDSLKTDGTQIKVGYTLNDLLKKEGKAYFKSIYNGLIDEAKKNGKSTVTVQKDDAWKIIKQEILSKPIIDCADISDMWDGVSNGSCLAHYGHTHKDPQYWSKALVGEEAFAEMFSATIANPGSVAMIKHYFPESYEMFEEILKELG